MFLGRNLTGPRVSIRDVAARTGLGMHCGSVGSLRGSAGRVGAGSSGLLALCCFAARFVGARVHTRATQGALALDLPAAHAQPRPRYRVGTWGSWPSTSGPSSSTTANADVRSRCRTGLESGLDLPRGNERKPVPPTPGPAWRIGPGVCLEEWVESRRMGQGDPHGRASGSGFRCTGLGKHDRARGAGPRSAGGSGRRCVECPTRARFAPRWRRRSAA